ncbi:MAG: sigma 54-interacting transcriptional regulator [Methylovulum sp.]|nr:sigma 54-interacting transcriptional regulator [Methylovulum sp.]
MKQEPAFSESLTQWLQQLDGTELCTALLAHCDGLAVYVLDTHQHVLHWSGGAENLTGFRPQDRLGKPCPSGYGLTNTDDAALQEQQMTLTCADGKHMRVSKNGYVLHDKAGLYAGGLVVLTPGLPQAAAELPKGGHEAKQNFHGILSRSPAMRAVFQVIENAAETTATVLVRGESGSGKELVARAIHQLSVRHDAPFLAINCAALSSNLLESELFGHVRGAFTGAIRDHSGLFQRAHGGTLFLDEVAELPLDLQAKLLRVIQERNYIPVGGDRSIAVDVRIVAATHRSLREQVKKGEFREDLMYRLRVVPIFIPPLRERREDIGLLLWHFIRLHNAESARRIEKIDPPAMQILLDYPWPGNVRELHNVIEYAFAVGRGAVLRSSELPPEFREPRISEPHIRHPAPLSAEQESAAISDALQQCNGMITSAARLLGMSRATFWRKRKLYGL